MHAQYFALINQDIELQFCAKATFSLLLILLVLSPLGVRFLPLVVVCLVVAPVVALVLVRLLIHVLGLTRRSAPVNPIVWRLRSGSRDL